ncbi:MAG: hypothetical protein NDF54_01860 [archaeon GB-1867-035]|nr:hypothetical protein [Candidatus Culexmicrobium profundum]
MKRIGYAILTSMIIILISCVIFSISPFTTGGKSFSSQTINTTKTKAYIMVGRKQLIELLNYTEKTKYETVIPEGIILFSDAIIDCEKIFKIKMEPPLKIECHLYRGSLNSKILPVLNLSSIEIERILSIPREYFSKYLDEKQLNNILNSIRFDKNISTDGEIIISNYTSYSIILIAFKEKKYESNIEMITSKEFKINLIKAIPRISLISLIGLGIIVVDYYTERRKRSEKQ